MKQKYESVILKELSYIIHNEVTNTNISSLSITEVIMSNDYSVANVYIHTINNLEKTLESLKNIEPFLRRRLSKKLRGLRKHPKLNFFYDDKIDRKNKIDEIINNLNISKNEQ